MHNGVDFACPVGTSVKSLFGGIVVSKGVDSSRGIYIAIRKGKVEEWFYHLSKTYYNIGQKVKKGKVALSGNTGRSTGPHLHYAIKYDGNWVDPVKYLSGDLDLPTVVDEGEENIKNEGVLNNIVNNVLSFGYTYFFYGAIIALIIYSMKKTYKG